MSEIWKPVPSYPGLRASSLGRICLPVREYPMPNGALRSTSPKPTYGVLVTASRTASCRYMRIRSRHFGNIKIHRAICEAFHGAAPSPKHIVLHLNEDGTDNRPENLKWGSRKENQNAPGFRAWAASVARAKFAGLSGMRKGTSA